MFHLLIAVWRIVQSWLSERAVGKVKYVVLNVNSTALIVRFILN